MLAGQNTSKKVLLYIALWFIIWAIVFEFILPVNKFLPAPTVLIRAFGSLWTDYNLGVNLLSSVSVIYFSLVISFFLIRFLREIFFRGRGFLFNFLVSLEWFAEFIPGVIIGMLLIFWYPQSDYTEFVFVFLLVFTSLGITLFKLRENINADYREAAVSLGVGKSELSLIEFNSLLPLLAKSFSELHFYVWTMLIVFEFINRSFGIGYILRQALEYKDLSAFTASLVVIGITIYAGTKVLHYLRLKFIFWK